MCWLCPSHTVLAIHCNLLATKGFELVARQVGNLLSKYSCLIFREILLQSELNICNAWYVLENIIYLLNVEGTFWYMNICISICWILMKHFAMLDRNSSSHLGTSVKKLNEYICVQCVSNLYIVVHIEQAM